jgi:hypothetical protein
MGAATRQPAATAKIVASARTTTPGGRPPGGAGARRIHHSEPATTATVSNQPTCPGPPRRATRPGSEALASTSGAGVWVASRSHSSALDGPAASTPATLVAPAEAIPAHSAGQRRCASGISSSGASDGFSATTTPSSTAASSSRPRRWASQAATSPNSSNP